MSFFKRMLSKAGIGAATVETELFNTVFIPGEEVKGVVHITGGNVAQDIDTVYLIIKSTYEDEIEVETDGEEEEEMEVTRVAELMHLPLCSPFTIEPGEKATFELAFTLPLDTPATLGKTSSWVETGLDIKMAVDPGDRDPITVAPHPLAQHILESMSHLGFHLTEVTCEPAPRALEMRLPFVQEFEFKPVQGTFKNRLDEVELVFKPFPEALQVFMEVDRRAKGVFGHLSEMLGTDESMVSFHISHQNLPRLTEKLNDIIEEYCA